MAARNHLWGELAVDFIFEGKLRVIIILLFFQKPLINCLIMIFLRLLLRFCKFLLYLY